MIRHYIIKPPHSTTFYHQNQKWKNTQIDSRLQKTRTLLNFAFSFWILCFEWSVLTTYGLSLKTLYISCYCETHFNVIVKICWYPKVSIKASLYECRQIENLENEISLRLLHSWHSRFVRFWRRRVWLSG